MKNWLKSLKHCLELFEAVDFICADGLIGTTGKLFTADKLKRSINAAITGRFNANVVTRRYGLRQQVLYRIIIIEGM